MSYRTRFFVVVATALVVTIAAQPLLVSWRHPQAVWLWCDMLRFCN